MNKKVLAAAVSSALGLAVSGGALAQTSTVQIGGTVNLLYYINDPNNNSTGFKGDTMENSENEIYVRGEENLGGGLSIWFQCASSADEIGAQGIGLCTRNSAVGFKNQWGNVYFGNWDTALKLTYAVNRGWFSATNALYGGSGITLFGGTGNTTNPVQSVTASQSTTGATQLSTAVSNVPGSYFRRQSNTLNYNSPSWNGFGVKATYSAANEHTGLGGTTLKPRLWSFSGEYNNGPLFVNAGFERHVDFNPGNQTQSTTGATGTYSGGDDDKWMIGAGYTFANNFRLSGLWTQTKYEVTNNTNLKVDGFAVYADWKVQGPHSVRAQYHKVNDTSGNATGSVGSYKGPLATNCGVSGTASCASSTGADGYTLVYAYEFSKRTSVGLSYNHLSNDSNANFSMGKTAATVGGNQSTYGMFINHRF